MSDTTAPNGEDRQEEAEEASPLRIALGFFLVPLLIVIGGVAVFTLFGLVAHEDKTVDDYLAEVTGGGINEPWQGALRLASKLQRDDSLQGDPNTARRISGALDHPNAENPDVRKFLVLALGRVGHPESVSTLVVYLDDPSPDVRGNTLWALGNIDVAEAASVAPLVAGRLKDDDEQVRGYAAYVLGSLAEPSAVEPLEVALNDPSVQVRGNAAVALARLGSDAGVGELGRMIDREYLESIDDLNLQQQQDAMIAAIQGLAMLRAHGFEGELADIRDNDPDLRVREAARVALDSMFRQSLP